MIVTGTIRQSRAPQGGNFRQRHVLRDEMPSITPDGQAKGNADDQAEDPDGRGLRVEHQSSAAPAHPHRSKHGEVASASTRGTHQDEAEGGNGNERPEPSEDIGEQADVAQVRQLIGQSRRRHVLGHGAEPTFEVRRGRVDFGARGEAHRDFSSVVTRPRDREKLKAVWAQLSTWRLGDGQFPELAVGDTWDTRLEVVLESAEEVAKSTPIGVRLVVDPFGPSGACYEIVGRVLEEDVTGRYLDAGEILVAPTSHMNWPQDTVLHLQAELLGSEALLSEPPDPLKRRWRVRKLVIRYARAIPDGDPNSWRPDWTDVRFRVVDRMTLWDDEKNPFDDGMRMADYLLEIDPIT